MEGSRQGQQGRTEGSHFTFSEDLLSLNYRTLSHAAEQLSLPDTGAFMRELPLISAMLRNTRSEVRQLINLLRCLEIHSAAKSLVWHLQSNGGKSRNSLYSNRLPGAGTFQSNDGWPVLYLYKMRVLLCLFICAAVGPRRRRCRQGPFALGITKMLKRSRVKRTEEMHKYCWSFTFPFNLILLA